jgi:hypothetical protein
VTELEKAVVEAARAWVRAGELLTIGGDEAADALMDAVKALETSLAANKPTGLIFARTWAEIPAGWFVQTPGGWWEVVSARQSPDRRQWVKLRAPNGETGEWPRDPGGMPRSRRCGPSSAR